QRLHHLVDQLAVGAVLQHLPLEMVALDADDQGLPGKSDHMRLLEHGAEERPAAPDLLDGTLPALLDAARSPRRGIARPGPRASLLSGGPLRGYAPGARRRWRPRARLPRPWTGRGPLPSRGRSRPRPRHRRRGGGYRARGRLRGSVEQARLSG